jgi:hypothetical protein
VAEGVDEGRNSRPPLAAPLTSYTDLLKLSQQEHEILARMAGASVDAAAGERRGDSRIEVAGAGRAYAEFGSQTSVSGRFVVYPVDVSLTGMSFLHGGYVHTGTPCRVRMSMPIGEPLALEGLIERCRLIKGRIHEAGLKLTTRLPEGVLEMLGTRSAMMEHAAAARTTPGIVEPARLPPPVVQQLVGLRMALTEMVGLSEKIRGLTDGLVGK